MLVWCVKLDILYGNPDDAICSKMLSCVNLEFKIIKLITIILANSGITRS